MRKSPTPAQTYCTNTHRHTHNIHSLTYTCTSICTKLKRSGTAGSCASALMCVKQSGARVHACVYVVVYVSFDIVVLRLAVQVQDNLYFLDFMTATVAATEKACVSDWRLIMSRCLSQQKRLILCRQWAVATGCFLNLDFSITLSRPNSSFHYCIPLFHKY